MKLEQTLLDFDASQENIPRQITAICPTRNLYPETQKSKVVEDVVKTRRIAFEIEGVRGLIQNTEDAIEVAASLARFRYSVNNAYISDIGAGLYSMLTTGQGLYDKRELIDSQTGQPTCARIILSMDTLYKALFGPLVNDKGRALDGAGEIVKEAKKKVIPILNGEVAMPRAYASIQKIKDNKTIEAVIEGEPIHVYRQVSGARDALVIDLDYFFFPAIEKDRGMTATDLFIHQIAGMTAFLQYGRFLVGQKEKRAGLVQTLAARKILLAAQAAYELRYFAPEIVRKNLKGRINIALRRGGVKDLHPSAVDTSGRIRFKDFSIAVAQAGQYFRAAMEETEITNLLRDKTDKILIPAIDKGAEFPPERPKIVYIKADQL